MIKTIAILTLTFATAWAANPDVTGTYIGTQLCDDLVDGERQNFLLTDNVLYLKQDGDILYMNNFDLLYSGTLQAAEGQSAEALVSVCGGDFEAQEIVRIRRIRVKNGSKGGAAWDADSIFYTKNDVVFGRTFSTCKWEYERTSTDVPDFACP